MRLLDRGVGVQSKDRTLTGGGETDTPGPLALRLRGLRRARMARMARINTQTDINPIDPLCLSHGKVLQAFLDPEAAAGGPEAFAKHFDLAKDKAIRRTKSWAMRRPDNIASYYMNKAM